MLRGEPDDSPTAKAASVATSATPNAAPIIAAKRRRRPERSTKTGRAGVGVRLGINVLSPPLVPPVRTGAGADARPDVAAGQRRPGGEAFAAAAVGVVAGFGVGWGGVDRGVATGGPVELEGVETAGFSLF